MPGSAGLSASLRRLNPFPFPSDTTLRCALLIVFALCGSASLYSTFWAFLHQAVEQSTADCISRYLPSGVDPAHNLSIFGRADALTKIAECSAMTRPKVAWQGIGLFVTLSVAGALYLLLPLLMLRWNRLQLVTESESPGLLSDVQALCRSVGLTKMPVLVWNPLAGNAPQVFGAVGRNYCALSGGFVVQFYGDRPLFRSIVLHELAHIRCGDIAKTYFAIATCAAFVVSAAIPAIPTALLAAPHGLDAIELLLRTVMWTVVIGLSGASVLRAREYYADVQTATWEGTTSNLMRILADFAGQSEAWWKRLLRLHPPFVDRRAAVLDPSIIFRMNAWDAFAVGFAAWLAIDVLKGFAAAFIPSDPGLVLVFWISATVGIPAVVLALAVGAVGIGVWRGTFATLVRCEEAHGYGHLGIAMGASALLPTSLDFLWATLGETRLPLATMLNTILANLSIASAVTVGCFLVFSWITDATSAWFGVVVGARSPRPVLFSTILASLLLIVGMLAAVSFAVLFFLVTGFRTGSDRPFAFTLIAQIVGVPALIGSVIVWAFPLGGTLWRRYAARPQRADWIFLDDLAPTVPEPPSWKATGALTIGIAAGLIVCLMLELVFFARLLPDWLADPVRAGFAWFRAWMLQTTGNDGDIMPATAALSQVVAAVIATAATRRFAALSGLFAAFAAGSVAATFNLLFFPADPSSSFEDALIVPVTLMAAGSLVALPFSIGVAWLRAALGRPASADGADDKTAGTSTRTSPWFWLGRGITASLCIAVVGGIFLKAHNASTAERETRALAAAAESGDADAQVQLASKLTGSSASSDKAQAVIWMTRAAEQGNAEGMYKLAVMYFKGWGLPQDNELASHWLLLSARKGNLDAIRDVGLVYLSGNLPLDEHTVLDLLQSVAETGNADAQNTLGLAYQAGRGFGQDDAKAVEWFRRAAQQKHPAAISNLASMYYFGSGIARDEAAAVRLFTQAAELGNPEAEYVLGVMQAKGNPVSKDETQAVIWLQKAAGQGYEPAKAQLRDMCARGVQPACG